MTALLYALARFVEVYGLWYWRCGAQWAAIGAGALYLLIESYEPLQGVTAVKAIVVLVNAAIGLLLSGILWRAKHHEQERTGLSYS